MSIGMTPQQKQDFEQDGFVILEDFLTSEELDRLLKAVDDVAARVQEAQGLGPTDPFQVRNVLAQDDAFLDLIDNPRILPLVVDAIG